MSKPLIISLRKTGTALNQLAISIWEGIQAFRERGGGGRLEVTTVWWSAAEHPVSPKAGYHS